VAVKIKLKRIGKIRIPQYRIVVADSRTRRSGRAIEEVGLYHPKEDPSFIQVDSDRVQHWLSVGARPTEPVLAILKITGDWQKFKGEPGAEGTLRTAAPKADRTAIFEAAAKEAESEEKRLADFKAKAAEKAAAERKPEEKPEAAPEAADSAPAAEATASEPAAEAASSDSGSEGKEA